MRRILGLIAVVALVFAFAMPVMADSHAKADNPCKAKADNPCKAKGDKMKADNPCKAKADNPCKAKKK